QKTRPDSVTQSYQPPGPIPLDAGVDGSRHRVRRSAGARRVSENVQLRESNPFDNIQSRSKRLLALPRETDDYVGREGYSRDGGLDPLHRFDELPRVVGAMHCLEDSIVSRLQRDVQMTAEARVGGHEPHHFLGQMVRK